MSILRHRYGFICSIGHFCATAMYLNRHKLRTLSSPLDWVGMGPDGLNMHVSLICNDFSGFLRQDSLEPWPVVKGADDDLKHDYYVDRNTGMYIYHDFPAGISLSESYPDVWTKYERRISRFYDTIIAAHRTLMVFHTRTEHPSIDSIRNAIDRIRNKFPGKQIDLLVIENVDMRTESVLREVSDGAYLAQGWFHRPEIHLAMGNIDLCDEIYSQIRTENAMTRCCRFLGLID